MKTTHPLRRLAFALLLAGGVFLPAAGPSADADRFGDPLPAGAIARIGSTRLRPFWNTSRLTFSPDGKTLASADEEEVHLWDAATGREVRRFNARVGQLRDLAFSPDGKYLAAAGGGGNNRWMSLWETATGKRESDFKGQFGYTYTLSFSPDGKTLASGGYGNTVYLWDVATGTERARFFPPGSHTEEKDGRGGHVVGSIRGQVVGVGFSPDGKTLFCHSGNRDQRVQYLQAWELATGKERWKARSFAEEPFPALFSPDGRLALLHLQGGVKVVDLASGKDSPLAFPPRDTCLAFSPDCRQIASWGADGHVRLWDVQTGRKRLQLRHRYPGPGMPVVAFRPDGKRLATAWGTSAIRLWDVSTGEDASPPGAAPDGISALTFLPDGETLVCSTLDGQVRVWEATTGKPLRRLEGQVGGVLSLSLSSDGKVLATADQDGELGIWDLTAGKLVRRLGKRDGWAGISPDGRTAACTDGKAVVVIDVGTGKEVRRIERAGRPLGFSPDGRSLAAFAADGSVSLWDYATGERLGGLGGPQQGNDFQDSPHGLSFAPDGKTAALVWVGHFKPGDVEVWDVPTGRKLPGFEKAAQGLGGWVNGTALSPDGRTLYLRVEGPELVEVRAYDLFSGDEIGRRAERKRETAVIRGGYPQTLFPAPGGRLLASMEWSRPPLVWDVARWSRRAVKPWSPTEAELAKCWSDLAESDPGKAYAALGRLLAAPEPATRLLRERLRPATAADPRRVRQLLADLESDEFSVRSAASRELAGLGPQVGPALRAALTDQTSLEARKRIESLLRGFAGPPTGDPLRALRGIQVLERLGSPEAREVLQALSGGAEAAPQTQDARAALRRLGRNRD
jgi:WD40 repeat protein